MAKALCYVVILIVDNKKFYLESEGEFCDNLIYASKWLQRWRAEMVASAYEGAQVEVIKTGEVLK